MNLLHFGEVRDRRSRPTKRRSGKDGGIDVDQDGKISKTEANQVPGLVDHFSRVDRNADGGISMDEYTALESSSCRKGEGT